MFIPRSAPIAVMAALLATSAPGQGPRVDGVVRDQDGHPVRGARVVLGSWAGAWTDQDGRYGIPITPGRYSATLSCPIHGGPPLAAPVPAVLVSDSGITMDLVLAEGRSCLPPLESVSHAELDGVLRGSGPNQLFRLCTEPAYRVAVSMPPAVLRELGHQLSAGAHPDRTEFSLRVRGRLTGPGFFGRDGSAGYLLEIETIRRLRLTTPAAACPESR